ncbi:PP2C family protein-serine/threonine phosphatase, partial [Klebsiella aerogenes]|uniref:PP2C family protein-serine/threonine phosphatase n=2 Tax=Pseudomonadota TaxID=1224 RepID=UPI0013D57536
QGPLTLEPADRLLLCSDGLWGSVEDHEIVQQIADLSIAEAAPELVEQALRRGGERSDNVTVLAVEWEGEGDPDGDTTQN